MEAFQSYPWPGNVRELRNVLERAMIVCDRDVIGRTHLPPDFGHAPANVASGLSSLRFPIGTTVEAGERELILQTLAVTNNKTRAAELLGISLKKRFTNKLKRSTERNDMQEPGAMLVKLNWMLENQNAKPTPAK